MEERGGKKDRASKERKESAEPKKGKQAVKEEPSKETIPELEGAYMGVMVRI